MKGGVTFFRSAAAAAVRTYFFSPEAVNSDYYLESTPEGHAERMTWTAEHGLSTGEIGADGYAAWVDFTDPETGESRGRVRKNSVRFIEKNINIDKSLSLAAAVNPQVAEAVNQAQRRMAEAMTAYAGQHFVTRVGPAGAQRQVTVEQLETVTHAHAVSRENEPHPHLHWQVGGRVYAEGGWRQLDTADAAKHSAALNALGENVLHADPQLRHVLAAEGCSFDPATGKVAELEPYVESFSTRAAQIRANKELLEANWRADPVNAGKTPGPGLRSQWDHMAWAGTAELEHIEAELTPRPQKTELADAALNQRWAAELAAMGFQAPEASSTPEISSTPESRPAAEAGGEGLAETGMPSVERLAAATVAKLSGTRSAWSSADIRAEATRQLTACGYIGGPGELALLREQLVGTVEGQCRSMADPRTTPPETARHWTTQSIIDTEDQLKIRLAARAAAPAPTAITAGEVQEVFPRLNDAQAEAAAALASGTRLSVIEGYAGTGKTTMLAAAVKIRGPGAPMLTVTPTVVASHEVRSAGAEACSLHKLLHAHGFRWNQHNQWNRLAPGETDPVTGQVFQPPTEDSPYHLAPDTQIVVDEAGMLDQQATVALLALVDEYEADLALMGDRAQLSAVGRGGVLDIAARVTTHHIELDRVHRFGDDTDYAEISKKLRNREDLPETFNRLYQRGNLRIHDTTEDAQAAVATEAVTDIQARRKIALTVPTNAAAAELNATIQAERIAAGQITKHDNPATGSDGLEIYRGDTVMTRSNNTELGVANRESFRVVDVHQDGALIIASTVDDRHKVIDAQYVAEHVHLGYAVTDYGNQGTTVDHGSVLLEEGMSGGGAYVGATRGSEDNTLHIVAEDVDEARATFTRIMGTDRADRGLDQARAELADELAGLDLAPIAPESAPQPLSERVQRYVETLEDRRERLEGYSEYVKPLHDYQQQVEGFRARHGTTRDQAIVAAGDAARQAREAEQAAKEVFQQRGAEIYQQARQKVGYQMRSLQTREGHARNAGILDLKGDKAKAHQMREALEAEHGLEVPRGKRRIKHQHVTEDHDWVDQVAKNITHDTLPADPRVLDAQGHADQAAQQAQDAAEHKDQITQAWNADVGDKPDITLRRDRGQKPMTYQYAQDRIAELDQRISFAANPENHHQVLNQLDEAQQRRERQAAQARTASTGPRRGPGVDPALDPHSPVHQAAYRPPSPRPDTGPDLGR